MAIIGNFSQIDLQCAEHVGIRIALDYVRSALQAGTPENAALMALEFGGSSRLELGNGVVALASYAATKSTERGRWETHVRFIDVQAVIVGEEFMELADVGEMTFQEDCTAEKDAIFYEPFSGGSRLRARPGFIAVFFPADAHRASLAVDESLAPVRKIVVKVPV